MEGGVFFCVLLWHGMTAISLFVALHIKGACYIAYSVPHMHPYHSYRQQSIPYLFTEGNELTVSKTCSQNYSARIEMVPSVIF